MKFFVISLRNKIIPLIFLSFTICLVIFAKETLPAAKNGLILWASSVVPSLFPFFVATELLGKTNLVYSLGKVLNKIMKPIFNVPGYGAYPFLMGIISGYPIGAKIVCDLRKKNLCTKEQAERLLSFTNNSGPLFIIGTIGIMQFLDFRTGVLLLITHILGCITTGIIFRFWKKEKEMETISNSQKRILEPQNSLFENLKSSPSPSLSLGDTLSSAINNSIQNILMIGGFVVIFSVVISIIKKIGITSSFIIGLFEITNGIKEIAQYSNTSISAAIITSAFLLGFGGISILLQVLSIISKSDLSIKPYILGKLLQGTTASIYTFLILKYTDIFNLDAVYTFNHVIPKLNYPYGYTYSIYNHAYYNYGLLLFALIILLVFVFKKKMFK